MTERMSRSVSLWFAICGALVLAAGGWSRGIDPVRYSAQATNLDPRIGVSATLVDFNITRWSTDAERQQLMDLAALKDQTKLLKVVKDLPRVGTMKTPDTLSYDLHYARRMPTEDGGERVVMVTDRDVAIWEVANRTRSSEYVFTVIELRLDPQGEGEGKISVATRITADKKTGQVVLEDYAEQPVRLSHVKRESK